MRTTATSRRAVTHAALAVGLAALGGCAAPRAYTRDASPAIQTAAYTVACPDTLDVTIADRRDARGPPVVAADGTVLLGQIGRLRVDGLSPEQITARIAKVLKVDRGAVQVRVTGCASRQVYLCGPVAGNERAVAYEGPEPVV